MKAYAAVCLIAVLLASSSAGALEQKAYKMTEDLGNAPLYDGVLQYYYYIPCPEYSWFWAFTGWNRGDVIGEWFKIGDMSTGGYPICDPVQCQTLETIRVLDFAGYGTIHPGLFTVEFDVYCADSEGCPVGPSLWNSGPLETGYAWNYFDLDPPLSICPCCTDPGYPPSAPRILLTATLTGYEGYYPAWGLDNISTALQNGCIMHDYGCLPAPYPRPYVSHYPTMHSGFYGQGFEHCPPEWFKDARDTTADGSEYGYIELAWRLYLVCSGPSKAKTTTWSDIKSMYE
jgi:hypothetical protein